MKTNLILIIFTALVFFAANSLLARGALLHNDIKVSLHVKENWLSFFMLFLYALSFSYAYINLNAESGALILFAVVQLTLIVFTFIYKEESLRL